MCLDMNISTIPHILTPESAPWVYWVMLGLLLCAIAAELARPGVIIGSFSTLLTRKERSYDDGPSTPVAQIGLYLFRIGTLAMGCYLFCYTGGHFTLVNYGIIAAEVAGIFLLKWLILLLIDYTFELSRHFVALRSHYSSLLTATCTSIYPLLLIVIQIDAHQLVCITLIVIVATYAIVSMIKWIRIFQPGMSAIVYTLIYTITLEILPIIGLVLSTQYILNA